MDGSIDPCWGSRRFKGAVLKLPQNRKELDTLVSRLSFPATGPPDPGRVSEGFEKGSLKGF